MPRRTKAESDATAATVLEVAGRLFGEHGYAAVRLEEVAAAAGVTRGAVYHHFVSKTGLFEAVAAAAQRAVGAGVAAAADAEPDPWSAFEAGCRAFLTASLADDRRRILLIDAPAVLGWDTWRQQDAAASGRHLEEALVGLADAGLVPPGDVGATAALLSGAMNEAALWAAAQDDRAAALDRAWTALRRLLAALRADAG